MHKVRALYIITQLELGGAQKQLLSLLCKIDKEKFLPFLITARQGQLLPEALSIKNLILKKSVFLARPINPLKDLLACLEIYLFIKKHKIDAVYTHSSKAGIVGRLAAYFAKVRVVVHTVHGWSFHDYQSRFKKKLFIWLERLAASFTHKIIVVSEYDKQKGLKNRIGSAGKYALIRYGINYADFASTNGSIRQELGIGTADLLVGMVSCFKPQKSPQDFVRLAFLIHQVLPEAKFILVGDGLLRKRLERLINKLELRKIVILTGWRRDIPRLLSGIDVFVLTSLWEGLPISVLEAMLSAKPVVVTHTGGIAEVVKEGESGFLVNAGNVEKMCKKLISLLRDESLRKRLGQNAKASLGEDFLLENMVHKTQDLAWDLLKKRGYVYAH